jgi:hypothetical protein
MPAWKSHFDFLRQLRQLYPSRSVCELDCQVLAFHTGIRDELRERGVHSIVLHLRDRPAKARRSGFDLKSKTLLSLLQSFPQGFLDSVCRRLLEWRDLCDVSLNDISTAARSSNLRAAASRESVHGLAFGPPRIFDVRVSSVPWSSREHAGMLRVLWRNGR